VALDVQLPDLEQELLALLAQVPRGRVTTYGDLADALGLRQAARWVGEFLREHSHGDDCPCHRVVRKGGELGLFALGHETAEKAALLVADGVPVRDGRVERFEEFVFRDFRGERPLARLIEVQHEWARRVRLVPRRDVPRLAAGLDVSYSRDGWGTGACVVVESGTGRVVWTVTHRERPGLPYIPSLLTFRELPLLMTLFDRSRREFPELDLYFVDGNGILHPRGAGVAACFGVLADVPTIGVAKSLLCGRLEAPGVSDVEPSPALGRRKTHASGGAIEAISSRGGTPPVDTGGSGRSRGSGATGERMKSSRSRGKHSQETTEKHPPADAGGSPGTRPTDVLAVVTLEERTVAAAMVLPPATRMVHVSPGQKMDVASAARLTRAFAFGHRLPEPLYWADRRSRTQARLGAGCDSKNASGG
jgi:deoxyribonuclease V